MAELISVDSIGKVNGEGKSWDDIIRAQINELAGTYSQNSNVNNILAKWHHDATLGIRRNDNFSPHINGFYMVFMQHGTWYDRYLRYVGDLNSETYQGGFNSEYSNEYKLSNPAAAGPLKASTTRNSFNMLATDIDVPDVTEEYISVSSRIRNSFVPSRSYFVSDFSISYIENVNLEVIRYHEAWFKYLELLKRGEIPMYDNKEDCKRLNEKSIFLDMPFTNAVWVAVFHPFTTDIQLLIKLMGVMPVTMPLKQIIGNRSQSKMTVLNLQYKAADIFYKFYNGTQDMLEDGGLLFRSFNSEILKPLMGS